MNLKSEDFFETMVISHRQSDAQFWSVLGRAYEFLVFNENSSLLSS